MASRDTTESIEAKPKSALYTRAEFFQNPGIFAKKFKNFRKFQRFLKYRLEDRLEDLFEKSDMKMENGNMGSESSKKLKCCREDRQNSDKISSKSEQKSMKRIQKERIFAKFCRKMRESLTNFSEILRSERCKSM